MRLKAGSAMCPYQLSEKSPTHDESIPLIFHVGCRMPYFLPNFLMVYGMHDRSVSIHTIHAHIAGHGTHCMLARILLLLSVRLDRDRQGDYGLSEIELWYR